MDLKTKYLGLELKNPLIISACSKTRELESAQRLEALGASAIVMPSLFEEEISYDQESLNYFFDSTCSLSPEAADYFPTHDEYENVDGTLYLKNLEFFKKHLKIPVIASLNGHTMGGWTSYAKKMEESGADALELNIYSIETDLSSSSHDVEKRYLEIVEAVRKEIKIPLTVKLAPYFSSLGNFAKQIVDAGADGLVLFNRFLEPDIDLETFDVIQKMEFSTSAEMRLSLHWTALLKGRINASLAAGRGVRNHEQFLKLIMAGADVVCLSSALYTEGYSVIDSILTGAQNWMQENEYESIEQMKGSMSYQNVKDPSVFTRANYMKLLKYKID